MRRKILGLVTATLACSAVPGGAVASDVPRPVMSISSATAQDDSAIVVSGGAGRYDRVDTGKLVVPLKLAARMNDDAAGYRILKSELFLKSDGAGARAIDALAGGTPQRSFTADNTVAFDLSPSSPIALDAIAACNAGAAGQPRTAHLPVAVVWRVTTGRFNFKWTGYDHVAPSDDIISNRDYYTEQVSSDAETVVDMPVRCRPLEPQSASIAASRNDASTVASPANFVSAEPVVSKAAPTTAIADAPAPPAPRAVTVEPDVRRVATVAQSATKPATKPECDGGMLRQLGGDDASYLCLCPGNTERIATGANAFACEKRSRRR